MKVETSKRCNRGSNVQHKSMVVVHERRTISSGVAARLRPTDAGVLLSLGCCSPSPSSPSSSLDACECVRRSAPLRCCFCNWKKCYSQCKNQLSRAKSRQHEVRSVQGSQMPLIVGRMRCSSAHKAQMHIVDVKYSCHDDRAGDHPGALSEVSEILLIIPQGRDAPARLLIRLNGALFRRSSSFRSHVVRAAIKCGL